MSEIDIRVDIHANLYWRESSSSSDDLVGRQLRSEKLNILAAKFEAPLEMLFKELLKDHG